MFAPIGMDEYIKRHLESNPGDKPGEVRAAREEAVKAKQTGAVCDVCGQPIWAIGSAFSGIHRCFTCITGEADNSEDLEIDSVCY